MGELEVTAGFSKIAYHDELPSKAVVRHTQYGACVAKGNVARASGRERLVSGSNAFVW